MESVYLLIPISIILLGAAVWAFFWAVNRGQFENLEDPAELALEEDELIDSPSDTNSDPPRDS